MTRCPGNPSGASFFALPDPPCRTSSYWREEDSGLHLVPGAEPEPFRRPQFIPRLSRDGDREQERASRFGERVTQTVRETAERDRDTEPPGYRIELREHVGAVLDHPPHDRSTGHRKQPVAESVLGEQQTEYDHADHDPRAAERGARRCRPSEQQGEQQCV